MTTHAAFVHEPDPGNPGWHSWALTEGDRFNATLGKLLVRPEGESSARVRMRAGRQHSNLFDGIHGGVLLALIDVSLFAAAHAVCGADASGAVTLDVECKFIGPARLDDPVDAVTEVLRETGRLIFLRGIVEQDGVLVCAYSGTIRKP